jgi:hypothetical protein
VLSNETLVLLDVVSALGYEVVFCRLAGLRAVGCVTVSDNQLVNELCECRVGSTESRLGFSHKGAIPVYCICPLTTGESGSDCRNVWTSWNGNLECWALARVDN